MNDLQNQQDMMIAQAQLDAQLHLQYQRQYSLDKITIKHQGAFDPYAQMLEALEPFFTMPFEELPHYVNEPNLIIARIVRFRLTSGV